MATHIINVSFGLNNYIKTKPREKHSYGQEIVFSNIKLPEVFEVYFSNSPTGKSKTVVGQNNKVLIPDEYFLSGKTIYCYLLVHDTATDGRMKYVVEIPIKQRPEPTDIGLDPVQQDIATEAIAALQEATTRVTDMAEQVSNNLAITVQNAEQSSLNADRAEQSAQDANQSALTAEEKATLANGYMNNAEQSKQDAEDIVEDFRAEANSTKAEINSKIADANSYANNAKFYSDLAEETVSKWINEENDRVVIMHVEGMNPKINATANTVYLCGELLSLEFNPCADGVCDIVFSSGTTPTLLTLPDSVRMPNGFTVLENRTYEINIMNGIYGVATSWA